MIDEWGRIVGETTVTYFKLQSGCSPGWKRKISTVLSGPREVGTSWIQVSCQVAGLLLGGLAEFRVPCRYYRRVDCECTPNVTCTDRCTVYTVCSGYAITIVYVIKWSFVTKYGGGARSECAEWVSPCYESICITSTDFLKHIIVLLDELDSVSNN